MLVEGSRQVPGAGKEDDGTLLFQHERRRLARLAVSALSFVARAGSSALSFAASHRLRVLTAAQTCNILVRDTATVLSTKLQHFSRRHQLLFVADTNLKGGADRAKESGHCDERAEFLEPALHLFFSQDKLDV